VLNNLRSRVYVEADASSRRTGRGYRALLGARNSDSPRLPWSRSLHHDARVHLNTCPVGVATRTAVAREIHGDPQAVVNFMRFIAQEVRELMAQLGFRTILEMVDTLTVST